MSKYKPVGMDWESKAFRDASAMQVDPAEEGSDSSVLCIYNDKGELIGKRLYMNSEYDLPPQQIRKGIGQEVGRALRKPGGVMIGDLSDKDYHHRRLKEGWIPFAGGSNVPGREGVWLGKTMHEVNQTAFEEELNLLRNPRFWAVVGILVVGGFLLGYHFGEITLDIIGMIS